MTVVFPTPPLRLSTLATSTGQPYRPGAVIPGMVGARRYAAVSSPESGRCRPAPAGPPGSCSPARSEPAEPRPENVRQEESDDRTAPAGRRRSGGSGAGRARRAAAAARVRSTSRRRWSTSAAAAAPGPCRWPSPGCRVTVVDSSVDALAILHRRAEDAGVADRVAGVQADADLLATVVPPGSADLVLCHHLLEEVDDPAAVVAALAAAVRPGGQVSVLVAGRLGAVLGQTLAGRFAEARHDADRSRRPVTPPPTRSAAGMTSPGSASCWPTRAACESVTGVGVLSGLVSGAARQAVPGGDGELAGLEAAGRGAPGAPGDRHRPACGRRRRPPVGAIGGSAGDRQSTAGRPGGFDRGRR